ncbi:hypothetical protein [Methylobacterium bullatum]|uniref:hypothetical protein n=1 Tax=Methylobacterium bullatum TaxID=570505 RepID=UPI0030CC7BA0
MSSERMMPALLIAKPALVSLLFICVFVPPPVNKILVALDTLILWPIIILFVCLAYKQAAKGKPIMEFKKNFNPKYSILIIIFVVVYLGFFVLLSLVGFLVGVMMPFLRDKAYDLEGAKLISTCAIMAFLCSNFIATYFGLRRYHRQLRPRG